MSLVQESLTGSSLEEVHGVVHLAEAIAKCNERFSRLVGFDAAALVGKSLLELCPELQADGAFSAERWKRRWQAARAGLPQWFPWQFRNRQGRRVHALINLSLDPDDPRPRRRERPRPFEPRSERVDPSPTPARGCSRYSTIPKRSSS